MIIDYDSTVLLIKTVYMSYATMTAYFIFIHLYYSGRMELLASVDASYVSICTASCPARACLLSFLLAFAI